MKLTSDTKKAIRKGVLLCTPFLLFLAGLLCLSVFACQYTLYESELADYYALLFNGSGGPPHPAGDLPELIVPAEQTGEIIDGEFDSPNFSEQWATLNVDGWQERDVPVYFGSMEELLRKGAAHSPFSRFCGQNGKVVLSAHVNLHFYEIEDSAARHEAGEEVLVTMDTRWGRYVYRVREVITFGYLDSTPLLPSEGEELLFLYTCYPRENSLAFKDTRIGLCCELVSGATWRDYVTEE